MAYKYYIILKTKLETKLNGVYLAVILDKIESEASVKNIELKRKWNTHIGFQIKVEEPLDFDSISEKLIAFNKDLYLKEDCSEVVLLFDNPHGVGKKDSIGLIKSIETLIEGIENKDKPMDKEDISLEKRMKKIIKSSTIEIFNSEESDTSKNKDSLALIYMLCDQYGGGMGLEESDINLQVYEEIGLKGHKNFDQSQSHQSLLKEVIRKIIKENHALSNKTKIEGTTKSQMTNFLLTTHNGTLNRILNSKYLIEASTLYYSIGNFIPMKEGWNTRKGRTFGDLFDLFILNKCNKDVAKWFEQNQKTFCMNLDYYKVIENKKYLDDIIAYSTRQIESKDTNCEGGTYNIASILELYNFFNLRIKLRSAWICAVLAKNSKVNNVNSKSRELVVKGFVNIAKQYEEELHKSIAILDCFAGVSERKLTKISFEYLTEKKRIRGVVRLKVRRKKRYLPRIRYNTKL